MQHSLPMHWCTSDSSFPNSVFSISMHQSYLPMRIVRAADVHRPHCRSASARLLMRFGKWKRQAEIEKRLLGPTKSDVWLSASCSYEVEYTYFTAYMEFCTQCPPLTVSHSLCYDTLADTGRWKRGYTIWGIPFFLHQRPRFFNCLFTFLSDTNCHKLSKNSRSSLNTTLYTLNRHPSNINRSSAA